MDPEVWNYLIVALVGGLFSVGFLTALPDTLTGKLTRQDFTGLWLIVLSIVVLGMWFVWPLLPTLWAATLVIWEGSNWTQLVALVAGLLVLLLGVLVTIYKYRKWRASKSVAT